MKSSYGIAQIFREGCLEFGDRSVPVCDMPISEKIIDLLDPTWIPQDKELKAKYPSLLARSPLSLSRSSLSSFFFFLFCFPRLLLRPVSSFRQQ